MKEYTLEEIMDAFEECAKQLQELEQENKQLKEDKKKAIEWVKKNQYYFPKPIELLEILGGTDENRRN